MAVGGSGRRTVGAGLLAAIAILIRPNLVPLALFAYRRMWGAFVLGAMLATFAVALLLLGLLLATHLFYPDDAPLARYDFLALSGQGCSRTIEGAFPSRARLQPACAN